MVGKAGERVEFPLSRPFQWFSIIERLATFFPFWPGRERSIKCIPANSFSDMDRTEIISSDSYPELDFSDLEDFVDLLDFRLPSNEMITTGIEVKHFDEAYC